MFVYLSKKIAIPNNTRLDCVAWSKEQGYIACGGEDGLLKILKLETGKDMKSKGLSAPSNLSMNQTLEGHGGAVQVVTWNEGPQLKLTSSDQNGLIVVWMLYKGAWFEEMINNRNKSVVNDMVWDADGQKICIVYEDGAVIVGSVDGNRIWGKDLKGLQLTNVQWSPDGKLILFGVSSGEVHVFDSAGSNISKVNIQCLAMSPLSIGLAGICWYHGRGGYIEPDCPCLAICYSNGRMQIMRHEADDSPILVDTCVNVVSLEWNCNGSMLAVAGIAKIEDETTKECNVVQFYTPFGKHLRSLKVPGKQISSCSWEGGGLRIALAVDSYIYFANVRPDYKWCYFTNTVVYTYHKPDRADVCVVFWDVQGKGRHVKYVKRLISMAAEGEYCVLSTRTDDENGRYALVICNAIGTPIDSKYVNIEPVHLVLTSNHIIAASNEHYLIWQYRTPQNNISSAKFKETAEKVYHVDDVPTGLTDTSQDLDKLYEAISQKLKVTSDPICALCASDKTIIVARESGVLQQYTLPNVALVQKYTLASRPHRIALNCNSTRLAVMDVTGNLLFVELLNKSENAIIKSDRKDVWDMKWSAENPELFTVVEKTRMYVLKLLDPEEPITSSGYICSFEDLQIRTVLLDEILQDPENPLPAHIVDIEVKSLRDTRELLKQVGINDVMSFIEDNSHPRLWRLLGEAALEKLDLKTAENAYVRCKDHSAIEYIKRLSIQNDTLKHAEVAAYFRRFDEAEKLYIDMDRRDLAVELRRKLGDWFQVVQLLKSGSAGDDILLEEAWNAIGDHFSERQKWHVQRHDTCFGSHTAHLVQSIGDKLIRTSDECSMCEPKHVSYVFGAFVKLEIIPKFDRDINPHCQNAVSVYKYYYKNREDAVKYYEQGCNQEHLSKCYYILEDYDNLEKLANSLPEGHKLLPDIANSFTSVGMCEQAVACFIKCHKINAAIDCCIHLNQWNMAIELAEKHNIKEIATLLAKYAKHLLDKNKIMSAVELFHKAGRFLDAARLLSNVAKAETKRKAKPLTIKKIYVLMALLIEDYHQHMRSAVSSRNSAKTEQSKATLIGLLEEEALATSMSDTKLIDNNWRGAEAYHFYLLAQRQLYGGSIDGAMKTALHLQEYDDLLDPEEVGSLLALVSCANQAYGNCSKAFIKLESLEIIPKARRQTYEDLAMEIFMKHSPKNVKLHTVECPTCDSVISDQCTVCPHCDAKFTVCVASGRPLYDLNVWTCSKCKHSANPHDMHHRMSCPLCHSYKLS